MYELWTIIWRVFAVLALASAVAPFISNRESAGDEGNASGNSKRKGKKVSWIGPLGNFGDWMKDHLWNKASVVIVISSIIGFHLLFLLPYDRNLLLDLVQNGSWIALMLVLVLSAFIFHETEQERNIVKVVAPLLLLGIALLFTYADIGNVIIAHGKAKIGPIPTLTETLHSWGESSGAPVAKVVKEEDRHWTTTLDVRLRKSVPLRTRVIRIDDVMVEFVIYYQNEGVTEKAFYQWNRAIDSEHGTYEQRSPEDHGIWGITSVVHNKQTGAIDSLLLWETDERGRNWTKVLEAQD